MGMGCDAGQQAYKDEYDRVYRYWVLWWEARRAAVLRAVTHGV